jgi:aldose sugar dehydrogenase
MYIKRQKPFSPMLKFYFIREFHAAFLLFIFAILILTLLLIGQSRIDAATPTIIDPKLKIEVVFSGLKFPTSMTFLDSNDILVLEKNDGTVQRIVNGTLQPKPILDVDVANTSERGMLGIAIEKDRNQNRGPPYVFLYFTESAKNDGTNITEVQETLANRLYRYELVGDKLVNPKMLLDLPAEPYPYHNGGRIIIGPDHHVYVAIGDLGNFTKAQNIDNRAAIDGRGGILRVTQDGKPVGKGILGDSYPLNLYYAYGIRNSFGIAFDPKTDRLWDTENGDEYGDEINLVKPGFNSGYVKIQGVWEAYKRKPGPVTSNLVDSLVDFGGNGKYSMPEFTWNATIGVTALSFFNSPKLGELYENDLFVGDFHNGNIYHFELNKKRSALILQNQLSDKIAETNKELEEVTFGRGFGGITDIQVGPDGYLYVLSLHEGGTDCYAIKNKTDACIGYNSGVEGTIFRIVPVNSESS